MCSIHARFQLLQPQWRRRKTTQFLSLLHPNTTSPSFLARFLLLLLPTTTMLQFHIPDITTDRWVMILQKNCLVFDFKPIDVSGDSREPKSWFGPNGQYIRELPCPTCRGRGYTSCSNCGIEMSRLDCRQCKGKGIMTCLRCLGDCVIWEESIDERPWEKARSSSPFRVKEDDEVDNLEIKFSKRAKSKRIYQSPPPKLDKRFISFFQGLNFTARTADKKAIDAITVQNWALMWTEDLNVEFVAGKVITEEPVLGRNQWSLKAFPQGITHVEYAVRAVTTAEHAGS